MTVMVWAFVVCAGSAPVFVGFGRSALLFYHAHCWGVRCTLLLAPIFSCMFEDSFFLLSSSHDPSRSALAQRITLRVSTNAQEKYR